MTSKLLDIKHISLTGNQEQFVTRHGKKLPSNQGDWSNKMICNSSDDDFVEKPGKIGCYKYS